MFEIPRVVPMKSPHTHKGRGGFMGKKLEKPKKPEVYAEEFKLGNTTVRIVAPPPMSQEEIDAVLHEFHAAGWAIINELVEKGKPV